MREYMIILKGKKPLDYSPEALQKRLEAYREWAQQLGEQYVTGQRLEQEGAYIKEKNNILTDGPFLESKEIIAGYIIIKAVDLNQAIAVTNDLPLLAHFEAYVRPLIDEHQ
ncbi:MAG: YciI family protein [Bacteroidota bacterium]